MDEHEATSGILPDWLSHYFRRHRCALLLAGLVGYIIILPFVTEMRWLRTGLGGVLSLLFVIGVWALRVPRAKLWAAGCLAVLALSATFLAQAMHGLIWVIASLLANIAFCTVVTLALLTYVMDLSRVIADKLYAAVSVYILIALLFAMIFFLLQLIQPGAFVINQANDLNARFDWLEFLYFSFTTLTSTGFGEITPATAHARSLIIIEQIVGVMYVAFLIARLTQLLPPPRH